MNRTLYLGIDVSKGYADFRFGSGGEVAGDDRFRLPDNASGREELEKELLKRLDSGSDLILCGLESTGGYENNWYRSLGGMEDRIKVCRINPRRIKAHGDSLNVRSIDDQVSAAMIASYVEHFHERIRFRSTEQRIDERTRAGRKLVKSIDLFNKQVNQLSNQLEKLLYEHIPGLLFFCRKSRPTWLALLLSKRGSAEKLIKLGSSGLKRVKGISTGKADKILSKLKESPGDTPPMVEMTIRLLAGQIVQLRKVIGEGERALVKDHGDLPGVSLLSSIKGIGKPSAIRLMLEIGDIDNFGDVKKLVSYFGLHPITKTSGDGRKHSAMSKRGRSGVRKTLYMCCISALRWSPMFRALYVKHLSKGKKHYDAMGVLMHKMLRIIFGILKSGKPFDPEVDESNRIKHGKAVNRTGGQEKKNDMDSMLDETAPISNRKLKALKKVRSTSQSGET